MMLQPVSQCALANSRTTNQKNATRIGAATWVIWSENLWGISQTYISFCKTMLQKKHGKSDDKNTISCFGEKGFWNHWALLWIMSWASAKSCWLVVSFLLVLASSSGLSSPGSWLLSAGSIAENGLVRCRLLTKVLMMMNKLRIVFHLLALIRRTPQRLPQKTECLWSASTWGSRERSFEERSTPCTLPLTHTRWRMIRQRQPPTSCRSPSPGTLCHLLAFCNFLTHKSLQKDSFWTLRDIQDVGMEKIW